MEQNVNYNAIRSLAKSAKYQQLYNRAKDLGNIRLFYNDIDFTKLQIFFLYWLEVYSILYSELATKEDFLTEAVISDDILTDAYLLYRNKKRDEKMKSTYNKKEKVVTTGGMPSIKFRNKPEKK